MRKRQLSVNGEFRIGGPVRSVIGPGNRRGSRWDAARPRPGIDGRTSRKIFPQELVEKFVFCGLLTFVHEPPGVSGGGVREGREHWLTGMGGLRIPGHGFEEVR